MPILSDAEKILNMLNFIIMFLKYATSYTTTLYIATLVLIWKPRHQVAGSPMHALHNAHKLDGVMN